VEQVVLELELLLPLLQEPLIQSQ
jgi:hypothetical protein